MGERIAVIRGELNTHSGYSCALRDHAKAISLEFDSVYGLEITDLKMANKLFPYLEITETELKKLLASKVDVTLIHYTNPTNFRRFACEKNVGLFYWESNLPSTDPSFLRMIKVMDEIWAPSMKVLNYVQAWIPGLKTRLFHWPVPNRIRDNPTDAKILGFSLRDFENGIPTWLRLFSLFRKLIGKFRVALAFRAMRKFELILLNRRRRELPLQGHQRIFSNISQISSRKAIPVLLSEWTIAMSESKRDDVLIIKLGKINIFEHDTDFIESQISAFVPIVKKNLSAHQPLPNIYFVFDRISEDQKFALLSSSTMYISTSLNEGFGGPIVEAIQAGTLPLVGRDSISEDIVAPDYPYQLETSPTCLSMADMLCVYQYAAEWNLPSEGSLARQLAKFNQLSPQQIKDLQSYCEQVIKPHNVESPAEQTL